MLTGIGELRVIRYRVRTVCPAFTLPIALPLTEGPLCVPAEQDTRAGITGPVNQIVVLVKITVIDTTFENVF